MYSKPPMTARPRGKPMPTATPMMVELFECAGIAEEVGDDVAVTGIAGGIISFGRVCTGR